MASNTSKLAKEVIDYSKQIAKLRIELTKLKKGTVEYELAERKLIQTEKSAKTAKENLIASTNKLNATNKRHKKSIDDSKGALVQYNKVTKNTTSGLASMTSSFLKTIVTVGKFFLAYQALNLVISAFRELVIGSVKTFIQFEDTLGKVQAVTSSTAQDMNNISEAIKTTAVETRFTATEIAGLAVSLGKLGATSEEIPDLLRPIATAAQAVGGDIAVVGEAILKTNNQFGIASNDTVVTAAIFADAINTSALSLNSLGTALQYVGPLASQVGLSLADTSAFMKVLADNGFTASKIGTGLRNIFIKIKESGKPLIETLEELADKNISLAESVELVGIRSAGQFAVLLDNIDILKESVSITNALTQARVAEAAQMKTSAAQLDVLNAVYENLKLNVGATIAENEALLNSIALLDKKSADLLRGQIALNNIFSKTDGIEKYKEALDDVVNKSITPARAAFKLLADSGQDGSKILQNAYETLSDRLGVTRDEAKDLLFQLASSSDNAREFTEKLTGLFKAQGKEIDEAKKQARFYFLQFIELEKLVPVLEKVTKALADDAFQTEKSVNQQILRNEVTKKYADELDRINKKEGEGINQEKERLALGEDIKKDRDSELEALKKAQALRKQTIKDLEGVFGLNGKNKEELRETLKITEKQIKDHETRLLQYDAELDNVTEINAEYGKERDKRLKATFREARAAAREFERRKKEIQDRLDDDEKLTNSAIDRANKLFALQTEGAKNEEDIANARKTREDSIAIALAKHDLKRKNRLFEIGELSTDVLKRQKEFQEELTRQGFDTEEIAKLGLIFEKFGDNLDAVEQNIEDVNDEIRESPAFKEVTDLVKDAATSTDLYIEKLKNLKKEYKRKEISTADFAKSQQKLKTEQIAILKGIIAQLDTTTAAGKAAENILNKQIKSVELSGDKIQSLNDQLKDIFKDTFVEATRTALNAINEFNKVSFENTINSLNAQKDAVSERASFEEDVLKSQLESQLISQEEYSSRLEQIKKNEVQRLNAVERKIFDQENKRDRQKATSDFLLSLASIVPNLIVTDKKANPVEIAIMAAITGALASVAYGSQLSAINKRQFIPKTFAEGGVVEGPSHQEGGVPFTVRGQSGYEMEGGEYIINKKSAIKYKSLLDEINNTRKTPKYKFATGGVVGRIDNNESKKVELLEAIAQATTDTVINTGRPVKAFVSSSELNNDSNARRIKERNANI